MGTEAVWVPLVLAGLGAGASYVNTRNTAKKQDQQLAEGIRQQARRQQVATGEVNKLIDETGRSNAEGDKATALKQYLQQLGQAQPQMNASFGALTGASDAYQGDSRAAALGVGQYGNMLSGLMSRIDGPQQQRRREGNMQNDFQSVIDRIRRFSEGDAYINKLKFDNIHRNPLLDAFASAMTGAAGATSGGSGFDLFSPTPTQVTSSGRTTPWGWTMPQQ